MSLEAKFAVVTGGGSGMGRSMAEELSERGATVAVLDIDGPAAEETASRLGDGALALTVDVASAAQVEAAIDSVLERFGGIDILCNNAGILDGFAKTDEVSDELWHRIIGINLTGQFHVARAVVRQMLKQGAGAIVNTASVCSFVAGGGGAAYTVSKHGVLGLTRQMAHEYGHQGIRVNCVCPGAMATAMTDEFRVPGSEWEAAVAQTPAGRWGQPRDVGAVVAFLVSDDAAFMTGAAVVVDGGYTIT